VFQFLVCFSHEVLVFSPFRNVDDKADDKRFVLDFEIAEADFHGNFGTVFAHAKKGSCRRP
jgi:hypothetical protein